MNAMVFFPQILILCKHDSKTRIRGCPSKPTSIWWVSPL